MPQGEKEFWALVDVGLVHYVQVRHHVATASEWESGRIHGAPDYEHW